MWCVLPGRSRGAGLLAAIPGCGGAVAAGRGSARCWTRTYSTTSGSGRAARRGARPTTPASGRWAGQGSAARAAQPGCATSAPRAWATARALSASRPYPELPDDVEAHHPKTAHTPSELKVIAEQEIDGLLGSVLARDDHAADYSGRARRAHRRDWASVGGRSRRSDRTLGGQSGSSSPKRRPGAPSRSAQRITAAISSPSDATPAMPAASRHRRRPEVPALVARLGRVGGVIKAGWCVPGTARPGQHRPIRTSQRSRSAAARAARGQWRCCRTGASSAVVLTGTSEYATSVLRSIEIGRHLREVRVIAALPDGRVANGRVTRECGCGTSVPGPRSLRLLPGPRWLRGSAGPSAASVVASHEVSRSGRPLRLSSSPLSER
jgi:hypothetical protein